MLIHRPLFGTYSSVLNIEVSVFQEIEIEELHCIQRCPHFRVLDSTVLN